MMEMEGYGEWMVGWERRWSGEAVMLGRSGAEWEVSNLELDWFL